MSNFEKKIHIKCTFIVHEEIVLLASLRFGGSGISWWRLQDVLELRLRLERGRVLLHERHEVDDVEVVLWQRLRLRRREDLVAVGSAAPQVQLSK